MITEEQCKEIINKENPEVGNMMEVIQYFIKEKKNVIVNINPPRPFPYFYANIGLTTDFNLMNEMYSICFTHYKEKYKENGKD